MWHTPNGDRKLTGAEAQAVRASIGFMIDTLECEGKELAEPWMFDIPVFDNLSWQQRISLLARVGGSLLQDESPPPELTAVNEAVVGAIYENLRHCLQFEIESGDPDVTEDYTEDYDPTYWRRLVLAAIEEAVKPEVLSDSDYQLPSADCPDLEEWDFCVEILENCVLWDDDWRSDGLFMDAPPEASRLPKEFLGIPDDYYTAIPPDPTEAELEESRARLQKLLLK